MKPFFFLFASLFLLAAIGCKKEQVRKSNIVKGPNALPGEWEYRSYWGGFTAGGTMEPGNGNTYKFTGTMFWHYENHILLDSGSYNLAQTKGPENGDPISAIIFNSTDTIGYSIGNDTLTLDPRAPTYDGIARQYVRIANAD